MATNAASGGGPLAASTLQINPDPQELNQVYTQLDQLEAAAQDQLPEAYEPGTFYAFKTAVLEIATNILRHAYPPGHVIMPLTLELRLFTHRVEAQFSDHGVAFNVMEDIELPDFDDPLALPEGGLGLFLARQALDRLDYTRTDDGVNQWFLVKALA